MTKTRSLPAEPIQRLPRHAYFSNEWLEQERTHVFGANWAFVGAVSDFVQPGDYRTVQVGHYPLAVVKGHDGTLRGFHNVCRHRGAELLSDHGNVGKNIVCPYHAWTYTLDGGLRGVPCQTTCFADLDKAAHGLRPASIGVFKDLVFIHPSPKPRESFDAWLTNVPEIAWPHDLQNSNLKAAGPEIVYEMKCNWKVFFENAVDGYHLAYLHKNTLGGPTADGNVWEPYGCHLVWYAIEEDGSRNRLPPMVERYLEKSGAKKAKGAETPGYAGVYMLFPTTIILPTPYSVSVSVLEPLDAETTLLRVRNWTPDGDFSDVGSLSAIPGYDPATGRVKSSHWTQHPSETGDFQTEDVWICEKVQRGLRSPAFSIGRLAKGAGGEAAIQFFQESLLEFLPEAGLSDAAE